MEPSVLLPGLDLFETEVALRLRDRPAADAGEDKLVEELVGGCEFFGEFTSLMATTMAQASKGHRLKAWS